MPVTDEDDEFCMGIEALRPRHVKTRCMIKSALHVFLECTMDRRMYAMVETRANILLGKYQSKNFRRGINP